MRIRIGKVTNIYPSAGKVKVMYEDEGNASLPLSMLTMNQEYSMPTVGDRVVTMHMENGSSKGFVLGTYYGGSVQPKANAGYRKDFGSSAYATCIGGAYVLSAGSVSIKTCSRTSEDEDSGEVEQDVCLKIADGGAELKVVSGISIETETDISIKAKNIMVEAEKITLKCSYGEITVEDLIKRLEQVEDQLQTFTA